MEHGQIVRFNKDYDNCPYITIKYRGQYLFLSTQTLNRREDFVEFVKDKYEDTGVNILDLPILDIIEQYVEDYNKNGYKMNIYNYGMIVRHKITNKYYGVVAARFDTEELNCYLIDLETFNIIDIPMIDWDNQMTYLKDNYIYMMNFSSLQLKIK